MNSILPKYDDLERLAEEAAIKIFMEDMKKCGKCGEVKSKGEFHKDKRSKNGLQYRCKVCQKAYYEVNKEKINERDKARYEDNKDKYIERQKAYNKDNKEKIAEKNKAYREDNKEEIAEKKQAYYEDNKEEIAEVRKAYYEDNKEKIAEYKKAHYEANKEKIAESGKVYREDNKEKLAESRKAYYESKRDEHIEQLKKIIEPNTDGKWIYIMQCGIYHKIGISNDPLRRAQEVENMTQAPTELIYLAKANFGRTIDTEQIIHHELSSLNVPMPYANGGHKDHVSKEWFFGSLDKMLEIVSQYTAINEVD